MTDRVILRAGLTTNPPSFMRQGELAYSPADYSLWIADNTGAPHQVAGGASSYTLTSAGIATALGYTPYDAGANAAGFLNALQATALVTWTNLSGKPSFATVATTGAYADLTGKPVLFDGTWTSLTGKPSFATVATTGAYADLTGRPTLGGAAALNVGTTAGTVAAGNDSRFGSGTVSSVAMTVPSELSVSGSPVTTNGTLALTWATETANMVFAGPSSGAAAAPTFRALVDADLPSRPYDIAVFAESTLTASEVILRWVAPRALSIASGASGNAIAGAASTGSAVLNVAKNGTNFGTVTFSSGTTGTVGITSTTALAAGDILTITGPGPANASLADVAITLAATRT